MYLCILLYSFRVLSKIYIHVVYVLTINAKIKKYAYSPVIMRNTENWAFLSEIFNNNWLL